MIAKEWGRLLPVHRERSWLLVARGSECGIRFLLAAVLAGAELFGGHALFALALVGVARNGADGLATLLGAAFGYLSFHGFVEGLRYIAAAMMVYAVFLALRDFQICRRPWFMPLTAALLNGLVGFVYLSAGGWDMEKSIYFATEVVLTAGVVWSYRLAFSLWEERRGTAPTAPQLAGVLVLGGSLLMTLARVEVAALSVGRAAAALAVLLAAVRKGVGGGAAVGVAVGMAMDFTSGASPYYGMVCGFGGLVTGLLGGQGRLWAALAYLVSTGAAVLWTWPLGRGMDALWEGLAGATLFLLLPDKLLRRLAALSAQEGPREEEQRCRSYAARRLSRSAAAFRSVAGGLDGLFGPLAPDDGEAVQVFDRAAAQVCRDCPGREACWHREYPSTRGAFHEALPRLLDRGEGRADDFPAPFVSRCQRLESFLCAVNRELDGLLTRRRYESRVRESRAAVCAQYIQLAGVLERAAGELAGEFAVDVAAQRRVKQRMAALGLEGSCTVYYDEHRHLRLELEGRGVEELATPAELGRLESLTGYLLRVERQREGELELVQRELLMAVAGVAAAGKEQAAVSGDSGGWFKDEGGRLYLLLCDGMGSGAAARRDSDGAVTMLEKLLRAGLSPRQALRTVGDALALRGEAEGGFTTVDLLQIDLYSGGGALYKLGAAPTYRLREGKVERYGASSLPAGLAARGEEEPDRFPLELTEGDCLVMMTDGVCSGREDGWLVELLSGSESRSPQELARAVLSAGAGQAQGTDDRTVLTVRLSRRPR